MRRLFGRRGVEADVAEELQAHLDLLTERYVARGLSRADARAAAARQLGNTTRVQEDIREMAGVPWLDTIVRDVQYACRQSARLDRAYALGGEHYGRRGAGAAHTHVRHAWHHDGQLHHEDAS